MATPALRARMITGAAIRLYEQRFTARGRFLVWATAAFALIGADTRRSQVFVLFAVAFALLALLGPELRDLGVRLAGPLAVVLFAERNRRDEWHVPTFEDDLGGLDAPPEVA